MLSSTKPAVHKTSPEFLEHVMWNGLFFGLVSLFTPQASLPDTAAMKEEIAQFAQVYAIDTDRIHVRESTRTTPRHF